MDRAHYTHRAPPRVIDRKRWKEGNILWALLVGAGVVLIELFSLVLFDLSRINISLLGIILVLVYAIFLFFLLEPHILREITHMHVRTVEKPVVKEVVRTVVKPDIRYRTVEKPVIKRVLVPVARKRKKLNIPKHKFFASDDTRTYHERNCRFRKLIKRKNQEHSNSEAYFKKKKYAACKMCIGKEKKSVAKDKNKKNRKKG
tara:strand:- start:2612 stop:3217 length:606 start_codon:yes stop_codon:yes gene_type:complete